MSPDEPCLQTFSMEKMMTRDRIDTLVLINRLKTNRTKCNLVSSNALPKYIAFISPNHEIDRHLIPEMCLIRIGFGP